MSRKTGTDFWGGCFWLVLHTVASTYEPSTRETFKIFIYSFAELLPCAACREHLKVHLRELPIDNYLGSNNDLFFWMYILHDKINKQLGKKSPPLNKVKNLYYTSLGDSCRNCSLT